MTHPIQIILTRQLASYIGVPLFLVDPKGNLLFYNEPGTALRRDGRYASRGMVDCFHTDR